MTKLQKARDLLMKQLKDVENGKLNDVECQAVIGLSDTLTKTYNTEIRYKELEIRADELDIKVDELDIFTDEKM